MWRNAIPKLGLSMMQIIDAVKIHIFLHGSVRYEFVLKCHTAYSVESKHCTPHAKIQHRSRHTWN
ncbi:unnamed protein product [Albugo candida]|uniref:Uncharacterized protein n=1 Tax=Albugo candida TaxID=65357 RepID=A0A024G814_9STRA|nr:unnamed protein product [Albugo candida]|eukprot:CCI43006.1 unnamed protein product [Albugo candida]